MSVASSDNALRKHNSNIQTLRSSVDGPGPRQSNPDSAAWCGRGWLDLDERKRPLPSMTREMSVRKPGVENSGSTVLHKCVMSIQVPRHVYLISTCEATFKVFAGPTIMSEILCRVLCRCSVEDAKSALDLGQISA